jgi:predicted DNA-binding mobile mystery protein A
LPGYNLAIGRKNQAMTWYSRKISLKDKDLLRIQQLEESVLPFREVINCTPPVGGWVRATREALGMGAPQLAKRVGAKAPQSIEDMQRHESEGTITLNTLRKLAEGMGCHLVYAIVPEKPIEESLKERATQIASQTLARTSHSMSLEAQGLGLTEQQRVLSRQVEKLLNGNLKRLWD